MKKKLLFLTFLFFQSVVFSQTANWLVPPSYDVIQAMRQDILKVKSENRVGIMDLSGNIIVPVIYDSIGDFYEGKALILDKYGNELKGIVFSNRTYVAIDANYIIDSDFPYFSCGYLAVKNGEGKSGFLTEQGTEAAGLLACKNQYVLPFSEDVAFIRINDNNKCYVNTMGKPLIGNFEKVWKGYSFYDGEAIVLNTNLSWSWINKSGEAKRQIKAPKVKMPPSENGRIITHAGKEFKFDELWRLKSYTDENNKEELFCGESIKIVEPVEVDENIKVEDDGFSKYYISYNGQQVFQPQFDNIRVIGKNLIAVKKNGKTGIIQIIPNQNLEVLFPNESVIFSHYKITPLIISVTKPECFSGKDLNVSIKENNKVVAYKNVSAEGANIMSLEMDFFKPSDKYDVEDTYTYSLSIDCDDILYYKSTFDLSAKHKCAFLSYIKTPDSGLNYYEADSTYNAVVPVIIKNTSDIPASDCNVSISCDGNVIVDKEISFKSKGISVINVKIPIRISEDYIEKRILVKIIETGCPTYSNSSTALIKRYIEVIEEE